MPKVKVNDIEMYYEVHGEGPPLVMLHGFTSSSFKWKPFISEYKKHFKLIIPDLRGHGQSTNPTNKFTHRQSAHDIYALLDHLEVERFKAMGYSSGGMTLIHMATQQPERIKSMVLMAATPHFAKEAREMQAHALDKEWEEAWASQNHLHKDGEKQTRLLVQQFYDFKDSYDDMNFTPPYLSTIKAKTLIVHGDRDVFFPVEIPIILYKSIPDSYLWIVPNTGHALIIEKYVSEIKREALEFLSGSWDE